MTFVQCKLEWEDGRQVYDVEFYTPEYAEYDYEIDAITGAVLSVDYDSENFTPPAGTNPAFIGSERAKSIALGRVPGAAAANVRKVQLDEDDGRWEYEVEIVYNGREYEFEIDALTGAVLKSESEVLD